MGKCQICGKVFNTKYCPVCGTPAEKERPEEKNKATNKKKPLYKSYSEISAKYSSNNKRWIRRFIILLLAISAGYLIYSCVSSLNPKLTKVLNPAQFFDLDKSSSDKNVFTLTAGNYMVGVDIPAGVCNVKVLSGNGNLISSNMKSGGVNDVFGKEKNSGYKNSMKGLRLPENTILSLNNLLKIKLEYTKIDSGVKGRYYNRKKAFILNKGNYVAGKDFPAGVYTIEAVSGKGNIFSTDTLGVGLNEAFGKVKDSTIYTSKFVNARLPKDITFSVTGKLKVRLVPADVN